MRLRLASIVAAPLLIAQTSNDVPMKLRNVGIDQKLGSQIPLNLEFRDETGRAVRFGELTRDKPIILSLVYYSCPKLCSVTLSGLARSLRALSMTAGKEFDVITVSFDPKETADLAARKKQTYLDFYNRPEAESGWRFLTGDAIGIERLTKAAGFRFEYDPLSGQYSHASAILLLTPGGRVSRYFYGVEFPARDLQQGIKEAAAKRISGPVEQLLLFCFHYDPATGKYTLSIIKAMRILGGLTVGTLLVSVFIMSRRDRGRRKARLGGAPS